MIAVLDHAALGYVKTIRDSMLRDRAAQFVARHGWPLPLTEAGFELDEFDSPGTEYCVVAVEGRHAASARLRAARRGSMVERHFRAFWDVFREDLEDSYEVTRLCTAPGSAAEHRVALSALLVGLSDHCMTRNIPQFFGVVYPAVARALGRAGWPPRVLCRLELPAETLLLATWHVSPTIHGSLQQELARRSTLRTVAPTEDLRAA